MIGLIGKKVGMTQIFDSDGVLTPVTAVEVEPNVVVDSKTEDKHGYNAAVFGAVEVKENKISKPVAGKFKGNVSARRHVFELRDFDLEFKVGDTFGVELFENFRYVDVVGTSKGKGYQGAMKRHNFSGGNKTHGSKFHRALGSTGMAAYPSKVIKGTKMPGHMGNERKTVQNLAVVKVDKEKNVVLIRGAVPGPKNSVVFVKAAKKKK